MVFTVHTSEWSIVQINPIKVKRMERGKFQLPDRNNSSLKTKNRPVRLRQVFPPWTQNCQPLKTLS